jgi:hypothetical protein
MIRFTCALKKRLSKLLARFMPGVDVRVALLRMAGYTIGNPVFIGEDLIIADALHQKPMIFIGNGVTIAQRVTLVTRTIYMPATWATNEGRCSVPSGSMSLSSICS